MGTRVTYTGLFTPNAQTVELSKPEIVKWLLGSHEYLLQCIEAWATQITLRYGLDVMFDIQWTLWGDSVLPGVKKLKAEYLGISGNTVADWMKDIQCDATAMPGKAFDVSFEMPEPDVGIMTFNRCVAVDQWESMGRPDILEKNCHSTCPKSMIVTTTLYNPNMKVEILAIPPRKDPGDVCCKWRFSMRTPDDPRSDSPCYGATGGVVDALGKRSGRIPPLRRNHPSSAPCGWNHQCASGSRSGPPAARHCL